jgi:hypothetical protein
MIVAAQPTPIPVRVDPALAEVVVWDAIARSDRSDPRRVRHERRSARAYEDEPARRDAAFAAIATLEFEELGLADPLRAAVDERPTLSAHARVLLVGQARAGHDEGVTCEPGGEHLGFRLEPRRFADPIGLARWARHALGHAEDTLDPGFAFVRGWDGDGRGASIRTAAQARLHRLWDISVDGRIVARGAPGEADHARHLARLRVDLAGAPESAIRTVLERLWTGPRPDFPTLIGWAERPSTMLAGLGEADALEAAWPDRCPLCRFPSDDVRPPHPDVAGRVIADYRWWRPEHGVCARCADRYRLAGRLGGAG